MPVAGKRKAYELTQSPLFGLKGVGELSRALRIDEEILRKAAADQLSYKEWDDITKSGKVRHIEDPPPVTKKLQGRISKLLLRVFPQDYLFCPAKRRHHIANASEHVGGVQIWSLDIQDYFCNTPREFVFRFYKERLRCAGDVAGLLADLTCFKGHLPTGSPSSPILAFFAHEKTWNSIYDMCVAADCRMSLYMDDLTLSGGRVPERLRWSIQQLLRKNGLRYHKERFTHAGTITVTGAVVGKATFDLPHRFRKGVRILRQELARAPLADREGLRLRLRGKHAHMALFERERREIWPED